MRAGLRRAKLRRALGSSRPGVDCGCLSARQPSADWGAAGWARIASARRHPSSATQPALRLVEARASQSDAAAGRRLFYPFIFPIPTRVRVQPQLLPGGSAACHSIEALLWNRPPADCASPFNPKPALWIGIAPRQPQPSQSPTMIG